MRRRIENNSEMSGQNYFKEQAALDDRLRHQPDPTSVPQYAYFETDKADKKQPIAAEFAAANGVTQVSKTSPTGPKSQEATRTGYTNFAYPAQPQDQNSYNTGPPATPPPAANVVDDRHASSLYSPVEYVAPRRQWGPTGPDMGNRQSPLRAPAMGAAAVTAAAAVPYARDHSPYSQPQRVPPSRQAPGPISTNRAQPTSRLHDDSALGYYEDPRYEDPSPTYSQGQQNPVPQQRQQYPPQGASAPRLQRNISSDSVDNNGNHRDHSGTRSPTASVSSHFTSVSQRGINPRWQPPPPPPPAPVFDNGSRGGGSPRSQRARNNNLDHLAGFDDFSLPNSTRRKYNPPSNMARHDPAYPSSRGY